MAIIPDDIQLANKPVGSQFVVNKFANVRASPAL